MYHRNHHCNHGARIKTFIQEIMDHKINIFSHIMIGTLSMRTNYSATLGS